MIVIDIGAHDGSFFALPYSKEGNSIVYAIEPIPELAEQIRSHLLPNLHVFSVAIGEEEGVSQFHINRDLQTSSLLAAHVNESWQPYAKQLEEIRTVEVPVIRLDSFIKNNSIEEVDVLKIDAQGYDFQVIKSAGESLSCIRSILLEVQTTPLYEGSASKEEIVDYLTSRGFRLVSSSVQSNGLEENLEFVRVNRYAEKVKESRYFDIQVPHVGQLRFPQHDLVGQLLEEGVFEGPEQAFLWLYLKPGDTFFDCGAHVGLFSCIAARFLQNQGRIVGFEPNPDCFDLYNYNLNHLGANNFTCLKAGLSDNNGQSELLLGRTGMSAFSTFAAGERTDDAISDRKTLVEQHSLDSLIERLQVEKVDLAKLDVEGWEPFVVRGAAESIKAGKFPIWIVEFTEANAIAAGSSTSELRALLEELGYTICHFNATQLRLVPEPQRTYYLYKNLFAVMDVEGANARLAAASSEAEQIAKDMIARWDIAINASRLQYSLNWERGNSQKLRQQTDTLTASTGNHQALVSNFERIAAERLALISTLEQTAEERLTLINELKQTAEERLALISTLEQTANERLTLINELKRVAEERQVAIDTLQQKIEWLEQTGERLQQEAEQSQQQARRMQQQIAASDTEIRVLRREISFLSSAEGAIRTLWQALMQRLGLQSRD